MICHETPELRVLKLYFAHSCKSYQRRASRKATWWFKRTPQRKQRGQCHQTEDLISSSMAQHISKSDRRTGAFGVEGAVTLGRKRIMQFPNTRVLKSDENALKLLKNKSVHNSQVEWNCYHPKNSYFQPRIPCLLW